VILAQGTDAAQAGPNVTVSGGMLNRTLRPGQSLTFKLFGSNPAGFANAAPELFRLGGSTCSS
jgi:hypothetical protein